MKQNRTHYTWDTKKPNNCFNSVLTGYKPAYSPKQSISILALLALAALFAKLKDI